MLIYPSNTDQLKLVQKCPDAASKRARLFHGLVLAAFGKKQFTAADIAKLDSLPEKGARHMLRHLCKGECIVGWEKAEKPIVTTTADKATKEAA